MPDSSKDAKADRCEVCDAETIYSEGSQTKEGSKVWLTWRCPEGHGVWVQLKGGDYAPVWKARE